MLTTVQDHVKVVHYRTVQAVMDYDDYVTVEAPAKLHHGIKRLSAFQKITLLQKFHKYAKQLSVCSYVPTYRYEEGVFSELIEFNQNFNPQDETFDQYISRTCAYDLYYLLTSTHQLHFYKRMQMDIMRILAKQKDPDIQKLMISEVIIETLGIRETPEMLLEMHQRRNQLTTAFQEHLKLHEYFSKKIESHQIQFTIFRKDQQRFVEALKRVELDGEYPIEFTYINEDRESLCLGYYNNLVENSNGRLIKRTFSKSILLSTFDAIESDIIFIQNDRNIVKEELYQKLVINRKLALGYLFCIQEHIHKYLRKLENKSFTKRHIRPVANFLSRYLHIDLKAYLDQSDDNFRTAIFGLLNRPIRVCCVTTQTEIGNSSPYWVRQENGFAHLQLVEKEQITPGDENNSVSQTSAHYVNPIEMCCAITDFKGEKFELQKYANEDARILKKEPHKTGEIKYLQSPDLWTSSMEGWLTICLEVDADLHQPLSVRDLLSS
jgi:hypothetical protein